MHKGSSGSLLTANTLSDLFLVFDVCSNYALQTDLSLYCSQVCLESFMRTLSAIIGFAKNADL